MPSYKSTLDYLFSLQNSGIKLGLERIEALSLLLAHPYESYPSVLVAGTNGKGSVSALLASILQAAGYRVGLYTSPHLVKFNERIRVDGEPISDGELIEFTEKIRSLVEGSAEIPGLPPDLSPTFFEFTTALAFTYFKEKDIDIAVFEVGMGGRLDATNIINQSLSIITSIGLDHVSSLGDDIAQIAGEKGAIIKENSTVICAELEPEARSVIERISKQRCAKLIMAGEDFKVKSNDGGGFDYADSQLEIKGLTLALNGAHQRQNAALAIKALAPLSNDGFKCTPDDIRQGLIQVSWPGRCEVVREDPKVILDCAHNENAAGALSDALLEFTYKRLIFVLGIMSDKDIESIFRKLARKADYIILTSPKIDRAEKPEKLLVCLQALIEKEGLSVNPSCVPGVDEAIEKALGMAREDDLICVSGSVFTVGEAIGFFEQL